jgi:hypothetical protein
MAFDAKIEFKKLCDKISDSVTQAHTKDMMPRIYSFFNNQYRRLMVSSGEQWTRLALGAVVQMTFKYIPVVGSGLASAADQALVVARDYLLKDALGGRISDAGEKSGELLVNKVAQAYVDAVRKLDDAATELNKTPGLNVCFDCGDIGKYLMAAYYYRHRIIRLRFYHSQLVAYTNAVDKTLAEAEKRWSELEAQIMASGPSIFKEPQWHDQHCKEVCYWPDRPHMPPRPVTVPHMPRPAVPAPQLGRPPVPPRPGQVPQMPTRPAPLPPLKYHKP